MAAHWTHWLAIAVLSTLIGGLAGFLTQRPPEASIEFTLRRMLDVRSPQPARVAIGFNSNLDALVHDLDAFAAIAGIPMPTDGCADAAPAELSSLADVARLTSFAVGRGGVAVERSVSDGTLYAAMVRAAFEAPRTISAVGGNAALMAEDLAHQGCSVLLGGRVGPRLRALLPAEIALVEEADFDEVHLVLEYPRGYRFGACGPTTRANRVIATRDETNARALPFAAWWAAAQKQSVDAILFSGLHLQDAAGLAPEIRRAVLDEVRAAFAAARSAALHFELASMANPEHVLRIAREIAPLADSVGFNEQELSVLLGAVRAIRPSGVDAEFSWTDDVAGLGPVALSRHLAHLLVKLRALAPPNAAAKVSRLHFHSLEFHMVVYYNGLDRPLWRGGLDPVMAGSLRATARTCAVEHPSAEALRVDERARPLAPAEWHLEHVRVAYSPVLICTAPVRTVGTGDAISATAFWHDLDLENKH